MKCLRQFIVRSTALYLAGESASRRFYYENFMSVTLIQKNIVQGGMHMY